MPEERIRVPLGGLVVLGHRDGVVERQGLALGEVLEGRDDRGFVLGEGLGLAASAGAGDGRDVGGLDVECHFGALSIDRFGRVPLPMS